MIVADETDTLDRALASIAKHVDGIFIAQTKVNPETTNIIRRHGGKVEYYPDAMHVVTKNEVSWLKEFLGWKPTIQHKDNIFLFDKARNFAMGMVPKDFAYMVWLDADDIFRSGEKLHSITDKMKQDGVSSVFFNYLYDVELDQGKIKNILIEHLRERIVINDGRYKWIGHIHETLIPQTGNIKQIDSKECDVVHLSPREKKVGAIMRNMKALEHTVYETKGKDPRPIYYLAKCHYDLHTAEDHKKAEKLILSYVQNSGWAEERAQAYEYLAEIYRDQQNFNKAMKAGVNALIECPLLPSTYLSLALTCLQRGLPDHARHWLKLVTNVPKHQTTLISNPRDIEARTWEVLFNIALKESKIDEAWASIFKLRELFPSDPNIISQYEFMEQLKAQKEVSKLYVELGKVLKLEKDQNKLQAFAQAAPNLIASNPIIAEFVKEIRPPKVWDKKSIVIYCGPGWTVWNPKLFDNQEVFIGGSEEAVIYATKELVKQGYKVTVYGDPGQEGVYDGVEYLNYFKFNPQDTFDILIGWRAVDFFSIKYNARKTYLWLHDVPNVVDFIPERLANITHIITLSKAHKECLKGVPDDKIVVTSNGFVEELPEIKSKNEQYTCIWTSSYDRGLQYLLEVWGDVVKAIPEAKLRIFYGWQLFDKFYNTNPERMAWKANIEKLMTQKGVSHGGRLPQAEIEKEYKKAGVWAYPTDFYEINCISAIKAQAYGAIPVVMDYAALKETVQYGVKLPGNIWDKEAKEDYKRELILMLQNKGAQDNIRGEMMNFARQKYNWEHIITSWTSMFI